MKPSRAVTSLTPLLALLLGCSGAEAPVAARSNERSGGDGTTFTLGRSAFSQAAENLAGERRDRFFDGNSIFNRNWTTAPASTTALDGLGPTFNARSCSTCHFKDGRGRPPFSSDEPMSSMLIRLSVPGVGDHGEPKPEPTYGGQLNPLAVLGVPAEGDPRVTTRAISGEYDDGTPYELAEPSYELAALAFGDMAEDTMISPRTAPQMVGLGLLEAIDEADIVAAVDADDADDDGISGRANRVWDVTSEQTMLGRFGWKANQPSLDQQNAGAFLGDIGITSSLFPDENCTAAQADCEAAYNGGAPEIDEDHLGDVDYYSKLLAVPARRHVADRDVQRGEVLFGDVGCAKCHTPTFVTGNVADFPELSRQTIFPYTDLLLHDLGDALADGRPDFEANGNEWRTPPLWGVGLFEDVNDHTRYLHDGRARNLEEAILWHGGEAESSRAAFKALSASERDALLAFLGSL
jgi:CxxC motif-containing protein (DUF1111 family)